MSLKKRFLVSCALLETSPANSLFRKILPLSPTASRFCAEQGRYPLLNPNGVKILAESPKTSVVLPLCPAHDANRPRESNFANVGAPWPLCVE